MVRLFLVYCMACGLQNLGWPGWNMHQGNQMFLRRENISVFKVTTTSSKKQSTSCVCLIHWRSGCKITKYHPKKQVQSTIRRRTVWWLCHVGTLRRHVLYKSAGHQTAKVHCRKWFLSLQCFSITAPFTGSRFSIQELRISERVP